jgi:hypothetical protein
MEHDICSQFLQPCYIACDYVLWNMISLSDPLFKNPTGEEWRLGLELISFDRTQYYNQKSLFPSLLWTCLAEYHKLELGKW